MTSDTWSSKLFMAVHCLCGAGDLTVRLVDAAVFIARIRENMHFPMSEDGKRQLDRFRSIRERLFGEKTANQTVKKLTMEGAKK